MSGATNDLITEPYNGRDGLPSLPEVEALTEAIVATQQEAEAAPSQ